MKTLLGTLVLAIVTCGPDADAQGYDALREQVEREASELAAMIHEKEARHIDVRAAKVALYTARYFLAYAAYDHAHGQLSEQDAFGDMPEEHRDRYRDWLAELPENQLRESLALLQETKAALHDTQSPPGDRVLYDPEQFDVRSLELRNGFFFDGDRVHFPHGMIWFKPPTGVADQLEPSHQKYFDQIAGSGASPNWLSGPEALALTELRSDMIEPLDVTHELNLINSSWIGNLFPDWLQQESPTVFDVPHRYVNYDIDDPAAIAYMQGLTGALAQTVAEHPYSRTVPHSIGNIYQLVNEPQWTSEKGAWDTRGIGPVTLQKFREWLREKYVDIESLNAAWETGFEGFGVVSLELPIDPAMRGTAVWYDFCRFHMDNCSDFFLNRAEHIKSHDPLARTTIKNMPWTWSVNLRSHGLDHEALARQSEYLGVDADMKLLEPEGWIHPHDEADRKDFIMKWSTMGGFYDFLKSIEPDRPLFDSELHGLPSAHAGAQVDTETFMTTALWYTHMQGAAMHIAWVWMREADGSIHHYGGLPGSFTYQPRILDAYANGMIDLHDHGQWIPRFHQEPRRLRIFYSENAAIQDKQYMPGVMKLYDSLFFLGQRVGFYTSGMLEEGKADAGDILFVPETKYLSDVELEQLVKWHERGRALVLLGDDEMFRYHEDGRERQAEVLAGLEREALPDEPASASRAAFARAERSNALPPFLALDDTGRPIRGLYSRGVAADGGYYMLCANFLREPVSFSVFERENPNQALVMSDGRSGEPQDPVINLVPGESRILFLKR